MNGLGSVGCFSATATGCLGRKANPGNSFAGLAFLFYIALYTSCDWISPDLPANQLIFINF